ncbi:hypothetical protein EES46_25295 [Streptomyces sp. ADI98-10]|nr:hypothetical protein EES46_25295 [Streptomyces sp. ADI98-10]
MCRRLFGRHPPARPAESREEGSAATTLVEPKGLYKAEPGDVGIHFPVAPADSPVHGFTRAVVTAVMDSLFADPSCGASASSPT